MKKLLVTIVLAHLLTGCLMTRTDVKEQEQKQVVQQQVVNLQKSNADTSSKMAEYEDLLRTLSGRVESLEHKQRSGLDQSESLKKTLADQNQSLDKKVETLQEALLKMENQIHQLSAEVDSLKQDKGNRSAEVKSDGKKGNFEVAEELYEAKDWKKAILAYQKYRDENPKGKRLAESTYKIGVCFQELNMKDEAKTFYDEVVNKFPNSDQARKAKIRIKSLKK